jgi:ribosome-binding protein aMBF1 (putative translation factor)
MTTELIVKGETFVVIPKTEYLRLRHVAGEDDGVDAIEFTRMSIASDLRAAREKAGLTQAQLAKKMGKSQTLISSAESGTKSVGARYVAAALEACGLPKNWSPSA